MPNHKTSKQAPSRPGTKKTGPAPAPDRPERIAKVMARAGVASRRGAERMIGDGRVRLNGKLLESPAVNVTVTDRIVVNGQPLPQREATQIWRYHKPRGCVTTHRDPEGRDTVFDGLPGDMPRVISIGRLDYNTEGLLLLTNDGALARHLELPATGWLRRYRVRARGSITQHRLDELKDGITIDGVRYGAIEAQLNRQDKANIWVTVAIREGKNREIRRIFEAMGLTVSRLIRISYGPFMLGDLPAGTVDAIKPKILAEQLGQDVAAGLGISADDNGKPEKRVRRRRDETPDALRSKKPGAEARRKGKSLNFGNRKPRDRPGHHKPGHDRPERDDTTKRGDDRARGERGRRRAQTANGPGQEESQQTSRRTRNAPASRNSRAAGHGPTNRDEQGRGRQGRRGQNPQGRATGRQGGIQQEKRQDGTPVNKRNSKPRKHSFKTPDRNRPKKS